MPRASARRDALFDLRECIQMAVLFQLIHDSDSDSEDDMEIDEVGREMDIDFEDQNPEVVQPIPSHQANPLYQDPSLNLPPYEWVQFERFGENDPLRLDRFERVPLDMFDALPYDMWDPISFDMLTFPGPGVVNGDMFGGFQAVGLDSDSEIDLDYFGTSDSESDGEDVMTLIGLAFAAISESRYIKDRVRIPKSIEFRYTYFQRLPNDDFRAITRLSRDIFDFVVRLIEGDPIFANRSPFPQAPVHWQVACALDRLGNDGQGVSLARSKLVWGLGHGTVLLYYRRVVYALCNGRNTFITWPDAEERVRISDDMEKFGFKGAVGFVDGTTFPLHNKPSLHGNSYFDRKRRYSIHEQVVCDNKFMIRHFQTGMPGSCHDSGVFSKSPMVCNPELFFSPGEYIISDSAYATSTFVVPAYRVGAVDQVDNNQELHNIERFNTYLARAQVVNEHTIGIFKARWTSLCGLRTVLRNPGDIIKVIRHVIAYVVLHNVAMERDPWLEPDAEETDPPVNDPIPEAPQQGRRRNTAGQLKRLAVRIACLAYHDRPL